MNSDYGKPQFEKVLKYCVRCSTPESNEGMAFDEMGICLACKSSEQKMKIDWEVRGKELLKIFDKHRKNDNYDCIVPISGGKDSCYQLHLIKKVYGLNPLAVTFSHNLFTPVGKYNLENILEKLDIDHIEFTPKRSLVNRLMKESLYKIGDACWHCHAGVGAFPLQIAAKFKIPLLIYGESPAEHSGRTTYEQCPPRYPADHFIKNSAKVLPKDMCANGMVQDKELMMFKNPPIDELKAIDFEFIYLGDYIFWDAEYYTEFIIKHYDWKEDYVEGTYKRYKSVECRMPGVHDYTKYLKRGFGRGTDFASQDIRAGIATREEGMELSKHFDYDEPEILKYYLESTGLSKEEFYQIILSQRSGNAVNLPNKEFFENHKRNIQSKNETIE